MKKLISFLLVSFFVSCSNDEQIDSPDLQVDKLGILYGYEDNEKSIYQIDSSDGSLTKVIELEHNVDWNLVFDPTSNKIIGSSEQNGSGSMVSLIVIDITDDTVSYPEFQYSYDGQRITDLVMGSEGILYGYEDNEKSIYQIDSSDGSLTKVIELEHNVDWNLVFDPTSNKIIGSSEQNGSGSMVSLIVIDITDDTVSYPEFQYSYDGQRITDLVMGSE